MGNSTSHSSRSRRSSGSSNYRTSLDMGEISKKIDEKEYVYIALHAEIDRAVSSNNISLMQSLASELTANIMDLSQLRKIDLSFIERGRSQRVLHNFELSLAKLNSILFPAKEKENASSFYLNNPDIVSDLIKQEIKPSSPPLPPVPENSPSSSSSVTRNVSLYDNHSQNPEDIFESVANEFGVLIDKAQRPIDDVNEFYQMDKGIFYLQVQLENIEVPQGSELNDRKFVLLKQLTEFRTILDKRSGEMEEEKQISQEISSLEDQVSTDKILEYESVKARALLLQETIERSSWYSTEKKVELLRRLAGILERLAFTSSPATSLRNSVEQLYGHLNTIQNDLDRKKEQEELDSIESIDKVLEKELEGIVGAEDNQEEIYGNFEVIRKNLGSSPKTTRNQDSPRGTVYANADILKHLKESVPKSSHEFLQPSSSRISEPINKRPLPLPRNYDDKIISDLPKGWQRLNEILDGDFISETDKLEILEIQKRAEVARNLFERKIKRIMEKSAESVDL